MSAMNERNFSGIDLNLLVVFAVLMRERSTTRAGERLFLSQGFDAREIPERQA